MARITGDQMDTLNAIAIQMFEMPFDQLTSEAKKDVLEAARPNERAGGGMIDINNIIRPLGFANGGDTIVPKEKPSPDIVPKEKPVNFKAIMAEFDTPENRAGPGEPVGIEKIIADQFEIDPRFTIKQRIKEMFGMGEGGGSILDDASDLRILSMKLVLKEAADSLLEMDEIDNMTPIEIESMYNSLMGKK